MGVLALTQNKLGKPYKDLEFLLECLKEVLIECGEGHLAEYIPWINDEPKTLKPENFTEKHVQLYSITFHLLNMVEENGAVQNRRKIEENDITSVNGLWANNLKRLKDKGITEQQIAEVLPDIHVEPVLTAHPTEAKRAIVLAHHRTLYLLLVKLENTMYNAIERYEIRNEIKLQLDRLWRTGEIYLEKPDVASELKGMIHYLTTVFPEVLPILDRSLAVAWQSVGFNPNNILTYDKLPRLSFGDWVGGDRDGHPFVTADVTRDTLGVLRLNALTVIRDHVLTLFKNLSFTCYLSQSNKTFQKRANELLDELQLREKYTHHGFDREVFRMFVGLILEKLPVEVEQEHTVAVKEQVYSYKNHHELMEDLVILRDALVDYGAKAIAYTELKNVIRVAQTFGFHLAALDIRQNSKFHDNAVAQLMNAAHMDGNKFLEWNEEERIKFLNKELQSPRPFTQYKTELGPEAKAVVDCLRVVAEYIDQYGVDGIGSLIVSMTRSVSDLLIVYLLAREAGLIAETEDGLVCKLQVVPLFETIEDLQNSPAIMQTFLNHPFTKRSLEFQRELRGEKVLMQQIMVGYSDSNKDGGILASQYNLSWAQSKLAEVGKKYKTHIRFFHGKGGSISRGAGPTHWFTRTLPHGSQSGDLRLTEQGETIGQKYANKINAAYNLELLLAGVMAGTVEGRNCSKPKDNKFEEVFEFLAKGSQKYYTDLLAEKNFIKFFSEATPIDVIENSKIGSRPSRRTGKRSLADLRAIPWVFSWSQSRFNITSWYGVGSVLEDLKQQNPQEFEALKEYAQKDTLARYVFTNVDTSLAATDDTIFNAYADLVEDEEVKTDILGKIQSEYDKTKRMLLEVFEKPFEQRRLHHYYSNALRAAALNDLHYTQVALLKQWRKAKAKNPAGDEAQGLLLQLLLTVNGIASALRITG